MKLNLKAFGFGLMVGSILYLVILSFMRQLKEFDFVSAAVFMTIGLIILFYAYAKQIWKYGIKVD